MTASIPVAGPGAAGFMAGAAGGSLAALAALLLARGCLHLRMRPTVLPLGDVPTIQMALFLLGLAGGGVGGTWGWALQFGLVLVAMLGARYVSYGAQFPIEIVGLSEREVDALVSRVVSVIWLRERDSRLLGPVPLIVTSRSPWEPDTVFLTVSPDDPGILSVLRFDIARQVATMGVAPRPFGLVLVLISVAVWLFALAFLRW